MSQDFNDRICQYKDVQMILDLSSLLDPRFKDLYYLSVEEKEQVYIALNEKCEEYNALYPLDPNPDDPEVVNPQLKRTKLTVTSDNLSKVFGSQKVSSLATDSRKDKEIRNYRREESILFEEDPLHWCKLNETRYKFLAPIARHILAIPASSVPSERIFSKAGNIINTKRSSLSSKLADNLIFLSHNQKQFI